MRMGTKMPTSWLLGFAVSVLVIGSMSDAHAQLIDEETTGKVSWEEGFVYGEAVGTADMGKMKNRVQAEQVAKRTAKMLAIQAIAETIAGVRIDSKTIFRAQLMDDDILKAETQGLIQNAHLVSTEFTWTPQGEPKAVSVVRVPIYGGLSRVTGGWSERQREKGTIPPKLEQKIETAVPPKPEVAIAPYTGLIIDASGKGVKPVMVPKLLVGSGQDVRMIYGPGVADPNEAMVKGFAGYARSVDAAGKNERVGSNPLVVKAERGDGPNGGDMIISKEDGTKILAADAQGGFLKTCKVVIAVN